MNRIEELKKELIIRLTALPNSLTTIESIILFALLEEEQQRNQKLMKEFNDESAE